MQDPFGTFTQLSEVAQVSQEDKQKEENAPFSTKAASKGYPHHLAQQTPAHQAQARQLIQVQ